MFTSRVQLNRIRIASAAAILLAVMISPIRPAKCANGSVDPECFRRNFGPSKVIPASVSLKQVPSRLIQLKAISCENDEEKLAGAKRQGLLSNRHRFRFVRKATAQHWLPQPDRRNSSIAVLSRDKCRRCRTFGALCRAVRQCARRAKRIPGPDNIRACLFSRRNASLNERCGFA